MLYSKTVKPVALPPGRAKLSTKPAPTGSATSANTIGTVRVACSTARRSDCWAKDDVWRECDQFGRIFAQSVGIVPAQRIIDLDVLSDGPTQLLQTLHERRDAGLRFCIVSQLMAMSTPMRRIRSACCARAASGHVAAAPPIRLMNSRRLIAAPEAQDKAS